MKTKIKKVDAANPEAEILAQAAKLIKKGEIIVCPTDTGYAFAANALDTSAVTKVFQLKGRNFSNPIHIAVSSVAMAEEHAVFNEAAHFLASHYLPGALTIVLPKKGTVPSILVGGLTSVGIRIPANNVILKLSEVSGVPLTATSANASGKPSTYAVEEVIAQFGENMQKVAMMLDQGPIKLREVSTIVDLSVTPPQLIRQGRLGWVTIREQVNMFYHEKEENKE